jgi:hypothetical protein
MPAGVQSMPFPPQQQMYSSPQFMHPQQFASSPQPPPQFTSSQQFGAFPQQDGYVQKTPAPPAPAYGTTAVLTTSRQACRKAAHVTPPRRSSGNCFRRACISACMSQNRNSH